MSDGATERNTGSARRPIATAWGAAFLFLASMPAAAEPTLFVASDGDSNVYLFGTVHSLRPGTRWHTRPVAEALGRSQSLWLETERESGTGSDFVRENGFSPTQRLSEILEADTLENLANVTLDLDLSLERLDSMRPWLAAATIGAADNRRQGFTGLGVDLALAGEAIAHGIDVAGLDPPDTPVRIFASLTPQAELSMLEIILSDLASGRRTNADLVDAWMAGDTEAVERIGLGQLKDADPQVYQSLIVDRNNAWIPALERLMLGAGSHFVAVGVLHVVGPDGLPGLLAERGYMVRKVQPDP